MSGGPTSTSATSGPSGPRDRRRRPRRSPAALDLVARPCRAALAQQTRAPVRVLSSTTSDRGSGRSGRFIRTGRATRARRAHALRGQPRGARAGCGAAPWPGRGGDRRRRAVASTRRRTGRQARGRAPPLRARRRALGPGRTDRRRGAGSPAAMPLPVGRRRRRRPLGRRTVARLDLARCRRRAGTCSALSSNGVETICSGGWRRRHPDALRRITRTGAMLWRRCRCALRSPAA